MMLCLSVASSALSGTLSINLSLKLSGNFHPDLLGNVAEVCSVGSRMPAHFLLGQPDAEHPL